MDRILFRPATARFVTRPGGMERTEAHLEALHPSLMGYAPRTLPFCIRTEEGVEGGAQRRGLRVCRMFGTRQIVVCAAGEWVVTVRVGVDRS